MTRFVFPPWTNKIRTVGGALLVVGAVYNVWLIGFVASPRTTDIGYAPVQPVPYSHKLHAGDLGIDCRYCHSTVERAAFAAVPATEVCMNCHATIRTKSPLLTPVRESFDKSTPVAWTKVHDLPDYVFFNHSAHVTRGVGCVSCHGRVDKMDVVTQVERLSMGWCLECHRAPENFLRPRELVTAMSWTPSEPQQQLGLRLKQERGIKPPTDCSTCHR